MVRKPLTTSQICVFLGILRYDVARPRPSGATPLRAITLFMPRPPTGNISFQGSLSEADIEAIRREKERTGAKSLSAIVEQAIVDLLDATEDGRLGIPVSPASGRLIKRHYLLSPSTISRIAAVAAHPNMDAQIILRSAIARLRERQ